jgi:hypothetical protein
MISLINQVCLVGLVCLIGRLNGTNQMDQKDQIDLTLEVKGFPTPLFTSLLSCPSNTQQFGHSPVACHLHS